MEPHNDEPKPTTPESSPDAAPLKSGFSPLKIRNLMPGIAIGILIGVVGFLVYQKHLPEVTRTLYTVMLTSFGVLVLSFVLLYAFKRQITTFIFGSATTNAGEVLEDAQKITDALTDRFADTLLQDVEPGVRQRIRHVLPRLTNWFIWSRFRNWWWQWVLGIFVALGGLTGTLLLMNQNELLQNQNALIQRQMSLEEASRRSALVVLMSNIMDKVDDEIKEQKNEFLKNGIPKSMTDTLEYSLSQSLIGQIAALSYSFKPYRYMEGDTLIESPLSPERGQLLITLTLLPLDTFTLRKIYQSATFESADLKSAVLIGAYLREVNLSWANLSWAGLGEADLSKANLSRADLSWADLRGANLSRADLMWADLKGANSMWADLKGANLMWADLEWADLIEADLIGADLRGANLSRARLSKANLNGADLNGADLSRARLSINQLSNSKSLYECKNLHDSLKLPLQQSHPQLFQRPKEE